MSSHHPQPSPNITMADIYNVLFRHKWKILTIWAIGISAAAAIWFTWPVLYKSSATLYIKYVLDNSTFDPISGEDPSVKTLDTQKGDSIINPEVEILKSFDLAQAVADTVTPSQVLAATSGGSNRFEAARAIALGLSVDVPQVSPVIHLSFEHPDPQLAQRILETVISTYVKMHKEIHQSPGALDEYLLKQTDELRGKLKETEEKLRMAKNAAGVIDLEEAKRAYAARFEAIRQSLVLAEAELAQQRAFVQEMRSIASNTTDTNTPVAIVPPPAEEEAKYRGIREVLDALYETRKRYAVQFLPDSPRLKNIEDRITEAERSKGELEAEYPQLITSVAANSGQNGSARTREGFLNEIAQARATEAKIKALKEEYENLQAEIARITGAEDKIVELQRERQLQEQYFQTLSASLERAKLQEAWAPGRISNILPIQKPTPASRAIDDLQKILFLLLGGSLVAGIAIAFATEFYLDRSFRRVNEVETRLRVPLFLTLPRSREARKQTLPGFNNRKLIPQSTSSGSDNGDSEDLGMVPAFENGERHVLSTYFETLRDRLIMYFEMRNLTHKPKLVAVTSCAKGAGVSTVASGLAAALSETGDGNVLLVDMNELERGAAAHFKQGKLQCGLDEVLEGNGKRESALVQDNLYVVAGSASNNDKLPRILHKRFSSLLPKLRASDYDYIIFDMPPVSQISPTPRLARFMDMVFMVVESERTDREVVKRATEMLTEAKANVGVVLNKHRTYVPKALQQEL